MSMSIKKRLVLGSAAFTTVAAAATLVAGVTFGFFSATTGNQYENFAAGTVAIGAPAVTSCVIPATVVPGDHGTCTFTVTTAGSENANVAIDVAVHGYGAASVPQAYGYSGINTPANGLYDATANGLQVTLTDLTPTTYLLSGLVAYDSFVQNLVSGESVAPGTTFTYTLGWSMPNNGGVENNYQGATSTFTMTVHSVQSANNADVTPLGQPSAGSWS